MDQPCILPAHFINKSTYKSQDWVMFLAFPIILTGVEHTHNSKNQLVIHHRLIFKCWLCALHQGVWVPNVIDNCEALEHCGVLIFDKSHHLEAGVEKHHPVWPPCTRTPNRKEYGLSKCVASLACKPFFGANTQATELCYSIQ